MYRNLSLSKKLLLGFLTVILLAGVMVGIALRAIGELSTLSKRLYEGPYVLTGESMGVRHDINRFGRQMANAALKGDYETYRADLEKTWGMLEDRIGTLRQAGGDAAQMQALEESIMRIRERSEEIAHVTKTIDELAFQTKILSLNASVEAAHAGAAGKGFGVVAAEAVCAVNTISKACREQAAAISQVLTGIGQISDVVQNNAAAAEESAAASEQLSAQAQTLQELVKQFRLRAE